MMTGASKLEGRLTAKGRAMRERIIESAARLIFAKGVRETSLDEVRLAVGASKSQLYHYFADKDELLHAVIDFQSKRIIEAQQPELDAISSIESLVRWKEKLVRLADSQGRIGGCPIGSLANDLANHSESHRRTLSVHFDHWAKLIEAGLLRIQGNGELIRLQDPRALSLSTLAAIQGGLLFAKLQRSSTALGAALDEIINSLVYHSHEHAPQMRNRGRLKNN